MFWIAMFILKAARVGTLTWLRNLHRNMFLSQKVAITTSKLQQEDVSGAIYQSWKRLTK